ncbi:phage tail tape measure protein [Paenibacillus sp. SYP-B3998]|uniref:Phage tail tape measure protein n=1 Tax=Paenibacillus sp. SYP-B3998 TaxID=2678564 RepID=A0A6G4A1G2_9BACL|nr:phage tail tape measure protein [Paenibacillus sp. SYP-B3998]NEW08222.1 phage tail tape measure protein [Paenibacillus sp. SYP-B3998]
MAEENLRISIQASLNRADLITDINKAIQQIENDPKLQRIKIKLKIDIESRIFETLSNFDKIINKITQSTNQIKALTPATENFRSEASRLTNELDKVGASAQVSSGHAINFGEVLKSSMTKVSTFIIGGSLSTAPYQFIKDGISYVNELNKSLTELSIVTMKSQTEVAKYGTQFHSMGMEMGISTQELARVGVEFARQGLAPEEAKKRMAATVQFAKISNLDYSTSNKILSATVSSMGVDINRAADVFSYMGDATATSADKIGVAIQRVGGTAGAVGVEFEKVSSWIATISSRTSESASTVGDSIKSILARFKSLKERGIDNSDGTSTKQVAKAFNEIGVQLIDAHGNFRNFGNVMDEIGVKWSTLSVGQREFIANIGAGTLQQSKFSSLMDGYGESVGLYKKSLDSAEIAQQKFNLYQEGTEAKLTKLNNAFTGIFQSSFESSSINTAISVLTSFTTGIDSLVKASGAIPLSFGLIGAATIALNSQVRATVVEGKLLDSIFKGLAVSAEVFAKATRVALTSTLVGIGIFAISFALEKLIGLYYDTDKAQTQTFESLKENVNKSQEATTKLSLLNDQYKSNKTSQVELNNVRQQMISLMPEVIDHYDSEGNAVFKTGQEIDELITKEKELHLQRKKNFADTLTENLKPNAGYISKSYSIIADTTENSDYLKARLEALKYAEDYINENSLMSLDKFSKGYTDKMDALQTNIREIFVKNNSFNSDTFLSSELINFNGNLGNAVEDARNKLGKVNSTVVDETAKIKENLKKFSEGFKVINDVLVEEYGIKDKNVKVFLDKFSNSFVKSSGVNKDNYKEIIGNYRNLAEDISTAVTDKEIDLSKMIQIGNFDELGKIFSKNGIPLDIFNKSIDDFQRGLSTGNKETVKAINNASMLEINMANAEKSIATLATSYQKLQSGEQLSVDETLKLAKQYPQLMAYLVQHNGLIEDKGAILEIVANKENNANLAEAVSLENSVTNTYNALEAKRKMYLDYYEMKDAGINIDVIQFGLDKKYTGKLSVEEKDALDKEIAAQKKVVQDAHLKVQLLSKPINLATYGKSPSKPKSESSSVDESDKPKITDVYEQKLTAVDAKIKESQAIQNNYTDAQQEFRDELATQINLYKEKQKLVHEEAVALRSSNVEIEKRLSAEKLTQKQQNDLNKQLNDNKNKIFDLSAAWFDYEKSASDANRKLKEILFNSSKDWISNEKASMELLGKSEVEVAQMVYDAWKRVRDNRDEYTQDQREEINKNLVRANNELKKSQMNHSEKWISEETDRMILARKSELEIAQMVLDSRKRMANDLWTKEREITSLTTSEQLKADKEVYEARKKLDDLQKTNQDKVTNNAKDVVSKIKDAYNDYYDGLIEAENKRHDAVNKNLDDEMSKYEESINLIKKSMSRESNAEEYDKSLSKAQAEAQDIQNQRNLISLDNSIEGQAKLKDIDKQYADKQDEIQKMQNDRTKKLREDNLDDMLEAEKKKVDAAKKTEDTQNITKKNSLDAQKKASELYWQNIVNDTALFSKFQSDIIGGHFDEITGKMEGFKNNISSISSIIGDALTSGITEKLQNAINLVKAYSSNPTSDGLNSNPKNSSGSTSSGYYVPTNDRESHIRDMMKRNSDSWKNTTDSEKRKQLEQSNRDWASELGSGVTYSNGIWYKGGLQLYHNGGEVGINTSSGNWLHRLLNLGIGEIPTILKQGELVLQNPVGAINNLLNNIKLADFTNIAPKSAIAGASGDTNYHFNVNIDKLLGGQEGAHTFFAEIKKGIQTGKHR